MNIEDLILDLGIQAVCYYVETNEGGCYCFRRDSKMVDTLFVINKEAASVENHIVFSFSFLCRLCAIVCRLYT